MSTVRIACVVLAAAVALTGCSGTPEPEELRESLEEVATSDGQKTAEPEPLDTEQLDTEPLECTSYLTITVRGTGEPSRGQLLSPVARNIAEARPDQVQTVDLDYAADTDVKVGGTAAVSSLIFLLNEQAAACDEQLFVLLGYSQGALVVGDALISPEFRLVGEESGELSATASERVLAIVLYGDPRFLGSEPYNTGTFDSHRNGILPRPAGSLGVYEDRLRDYCVARDFICQSSFDLDESGHIAYYDNGMQQDGAAFVITQMPPLVEVDETDADGGGTNDSDADEGVGSGR